MARYFVHNLETDKLEIHTGGKADWMTLSEPDRNEIKRSCLWSGSRGCWISRSKSGGTGFYFLQGHLKRLGFEDRGKEGEWLAFAEKVEQEQARAEERAERMEDRAERAAKEAAQRFKAAHDATSMIPMGQPILIGHHSEARHRAALTRSDNNMRKGCEATDKRDHYRSRAAAARSTADASKYSDSGFLQRRISEAEADERRILRKLAGEFWPDSDPSRREPPTEEYLERLTAALAEIQDQLGFYRQCLADCPNVWTRETLKGKTLVFIRGRWERVVRLNPKTVSVYNTVFPTEESQRKWPLKYEYGDVKDAK